MFSRVVLHVLDKTAVILKPISVTLSSGLGVTCMKIKSVHMSQNTPVYLQSSHSLFWQIWLIHGP